MSNEVGRKTVMTPEAIQVLEEAFLYGASDKEAIFLAKISKSTFYDYCKENPEFVDRIEGLRDMPKYKARKNIVNKINEGDVDTSKWYAERKAKEEFSNRTDMKIDANINGPDIIKLDE